MIDSTPYGRRLVPILIDEIAEQDPDRVFACIPKTTDLKDGFRNITYANFARAINRAAGWIENTIGPSENGKFETLAYIGPFDLRYYVMVLAACKLGYKMLLTSPRNSLEGQLDLLNKTDCKVILSARGYNIQPELLSQSGASLLHVQELEELLATGEINKYNFSKSFEAAVKDPFVVLHTSGSTGLLKPVILTHGWPTAFDSHSRLPELNGYSALFPELGNKRTFSSLPPFHAAGITIGLFNPLFSNTTVVWPLSNRPVSAVLVDEMLDAANFDVLFLPPSILEELIPSPSSLSKLEKLHAVAFGGGPLSRTAGDMICRKVKLVNAIGTTEVGAPPIYQKDPEDWEYFHYHPDHKGIEFRPMGDGTYDMVIVRHALTDQFHATFWTFPDLDEYSMNDLYTKHPTKPNLWLYVGRTDDIIVLSNREKLNPTSMEVTLRDHLSVKGALVVGHARFAPGAIIELKDEAATSMVTHREKAQFVGEEIWEFAARANKTAPAHAQLLQDEIILSNPMKLFLRAAKGTLQRQATVKLYADEIEELYRWSEDEESVVDLPKIDVRQDGEGLKEKIGGLVCKVLGLTSVEHDQDLFNSGMDSLHVMTLVKRLKASMVGVPQEQINTRLVY